MGHLEGLCHVYVDRAADLEMAKAITLNAKLRRTGICGAAETLLVDRDCANTHLAPIVTELLDAACEVRGDVGTQQVDQRVKPATTEDWSTEYLDSIISVKLVGGCCHLSLCAAQGRNRKGLMSSCQTMRANRAKLP